MPPPLALAFAAFALALAFAGVARVLARAVQVRRRRHPVEITPCHWEVALGGWRRAWFVDGRGAFLPRCPGAQKFHVAGSMELVVGGGQEIERDSYAQTTLVQVGVHSNASIAMTCVAVVGALPWYGKSASVGDCTAPAAPVVGLLSPISVGVWYPDADGDQAKAGVVHSTGLDGAVCSGASAAASSAGDAAAASLLYSSVLEWLRGDSAA